MRDGGLDDGYEQEICGAAATIAGGKHDRNRVVVPFGAIAAQRDLTTSVGSAGGYLPGAPPTAAVDILRPWSVTAGAGVAVLDNLSIT